MGLNEKQLTELLSQYISEENKLDGAGNAVSQVRIQVENAIRASSLEGTPEEERAIALKYLNPVFSFCNIAMTQYSQNILKVQGKIELLKASLEIQETDLAEETASKSVSEEAKSEG